MTRPGARRWHREVTITALTLVWVCVPKVAGDDHPVRWYLDFCGPTESDPDGHIGLAAARYWTDVVGVAFARDIAIDIPATPLDLNLDGHPDVSFSRHCDLPGGLLANADRVGFRATPEDPAGTAGEYTISTGFLGVREEMDSRTQRGTGRYAFNCWLCHGSTDAAGRVYLGRPNTQIDLGLIMATSRVLDPDWVIRDRPTGPPISPDELVKREGVAGVLNFDANGDGRITIAEWRAAQQMPSANEARATLLLAGPGRLDQSIDHRMDGLVPLANLQHHTLASVGSDAYRKQALRPKRAIFNPVSIPDNRPGIGVAHFSWSGKDSSMRVDAVAWLTEKLGISTHDLAVRMVMERGVEGDDEVFQRMITLDLRNVGTAGKECDDLGGIEWPERLLTRPSLEMLTEVPRKFGVVPLRSLLVKSRESAAPPAESALIESGRRLFLEKPCGAIVNQRVLIARDVKAPRELAGISGLAPLDRSKPVTERIEVRCATCHNYSPTSTKVAIATPIIGFQRCDLCHLDHPEIERASEERAHRSAEGRFVSIIEYRRSQGIDDLDGCVQCHHEHPDFGAQVYSNSWLLPFDANGNGETFGDEIADADAGGIGTDGYLQADTLFSVQLAPPGRRPRRMFLVLDDARAAPQKPLFSSAGSGWVRVAPLMSLEASAPYLHNGSVPALVVLMNAPAQRPATFALGSAAQAFDYDTRLPGNFNGGHVFGTEWSADEKMAVVEYLCALP